MDSKTKISIYHLLDTISVDINYKDKIFLEKTKKYKELAAIKKKDSNYSQLIKRKKKLTFTEVKLDLLSIIGKDELKKLEEKYVYDKTRSAKLADQRFSESFKDAIIEAYDEFISEIMEYREGIDSKDAKKKVSYHFSKLKVLLDVIAKSMICYGNGIASIEEQNNQSFPKTNIKKTVPLFIRRMCVLICYTLLEFDNYVSIKLEKKFVKDNRGICKEIMTDLRKRCVALGYEYFAKEDKLFQYDKWSIKPDVLLRRDSYIPPRSPINYAGAKQGWLGYMIAELQKQVIYKTYLEAFGGSGIGIAQFKHNKEARYVINDFHYANVCYYRILNSSPIEFTQFLACLDDIRLAIQEAERVRNEENKKKINGERERFNKKIENLFMLYTWSSDVCINNQKKQDIDSGKICNDFVQAMKGLGLSYENCPYQQHIIIAAVFTAFMNMLVRGSLSKNIIGNTKRFLRKTSAEFRREFASIRQAYDRVEVENSYGANALDLLEDRKYNNENVLVYLDSPYIGTMEYHASKNSNCLDQQYNISVENIGTQFLSSDFNMKDLLDKCENFKGNYIFSCRLNMVAPEPLAIITNAYKGITCSRLNKRKVLEHFNNYLWFFKRWLSMRNIEHCYMFCMIDTDFHLLDQHHYYDMEEIPYFYKSVDKNMKKRFLSADWGMELSQHLKENIFNYLRAIVLHGKNFEIMITNYDCEPPNFDGMYEYMDNVYEKRNYSILSKEKKGITKIGEEVTELKKGKDTEIYIPENGMFVKIPMKLVAELVVSEFSNIKNLRGLIRKDYS